MRGEIFVVGAGGHGSLVGFLRLPSNGVAWQSFPSVNGFNAPSPFYGTVNGVGTEDGFYMFGRSNAAVYQPFTGDSTRWTQLPSWSSSALSRFQGATAVVNEQIYMLGGYASANPEAQRVSNAVTIFNCTSRRYTDGVPLTSGRMGLAAASYNGKVYVFGGRTPNNEITNLVEEFDPATGRWTSKSPMPEPWEQMSTGPLPVNPDGTILIPFSYKRRNIGVSTSLIYNVQTDSWSTGPRPAIPLGRYVVAQGSLS